jgi:ATP-dependent exoDNAse (exonuclease V) beta subunit
MHRTIKQIAIEGPSAWPERRLNKMPISWRAQLKELGVLVSEQELASMSKALVNMLNDDDGLWILQPHTQAHCEQALGYSAAVAGCRDGGVSVIDRTFVTDGVRWIIDYKFSAPNADESVAVFSARQTTAYRAQLQHYANLYRQIDTTPVRGALYFPQIPLFIEVSLD